MQIDAPLPDVLSADRLREILHRHWPFPADATRVEPVPGAHRHAVLFLTHPDRSGVLRIAPPDGAGLLYYEVNAFSREPQILQRVAEDSGLPVPAVWTHDDTREILPREFLILERLPGTPPALSTGSPPETADDLLRELGRHVRALHTITGPQFGLHGPGSPMEPERHWFPAFETMTGHLLDDAGSCGAITAEDAVRLGRLLYRLRSVFPPLRSASLCHRGLAWHRLLVDGGRITGILGWERAVWGDPEIEFAALDVAGMARPAFWEGYGATRPADRPAKIRRKLYILFDLVDRVAAGRRRGADPEAEKTARQAALQLAAELERE